MFCKKKLTPRMVGTYSEHINSNATVIVNFI